MTETTAVNPLAKHFRQPAIYINLTSKGKFWKDGALDLPATGVIPVYPMTARDEITLKTPDALINGTSIVQVIQSCCPNIKDAWAMPSVDVDTTLIAIRLASYGENMAVTAKCPHCNVEHDYDVNLQNVLSKVKMPDYDSTLNLENGLIIKFKPITYAQVSKAGNATFEEEKLVQSLINPDIPEEVRLAEYDKHIDKMIKISNENITNCTEYILLEDGTKVLDHNFIAEYYSNAESKVLRAVQAKIEEFAKSISIKPEDTICTDCNEQFKLAIDFDYAHFFDRGF